MNLAAKEFATSLYNDPAYRANFAKAFIARKVPSAVEIMVWHYACGKPKETVDATVTMNADAVRAKATQARVFSNDS